MAPSKQAFSIDFDNIGWLDGLEDDPGDYCAHAHAVALIGDETLQYEATVSATALYLLKSLNEDHHAYKEEQFLPCDTVVNAFGLKKDEAMIAALKDAVPETYVVGDARKIGLIGDATCSAFDACLEIDA